jgi:hypothetical protein|tara:strand:+ start:440 stop:1021 length:582 start_codon:yes stop_codon:yes gene_type:complete
MFIDFDEFPKLDNLQVKELVLFYKNFETELKSNKGLIEELKKFKNKLDNLFSGSNQPKTVKQVFFVKCSNEIKSRTKYDSIDKVFSIIESHELHSLGEAFLKVKAVKLKIQLLKNLNLADESLNLSPKQILSDQSACCISCGDDYSLERKKLGYKVCIKCSTVKPNTFVDKGFQTREGHKIMSSKGYRNSKNR